MATSKPDLTRIWASAAPSGNIEDPDVTSPNKFQDGWEAEIPPFENFNFLQQLFTQGLAHANEFGIMQWDLDTDYPVDGWARSTVDGQVYISLVTPNINNEPSVSVTEWILLSKYINSVPSTSGIFEFVSSTELKFNQFNGNSLNINGNNELIPSSGVSLGVAGLLASTTYFIYAFMLGSTMTLEASTTGHSTHTNGVEIKTGDSTRSLVGMAQSDGVANWETSNLLLLSWFNRKSKSAVNHFTTSRTTASITAIEINPEIRIEFLTWGDVDANGTGYSFSSIASFVYSAVAIDSVTANSRGGTASFSTTGSAVAPAYKSGSETEGYHFATLQGFVAAGTGTWIGSALSGGQRTELQLTIKG